MPGSLEVTKDTSFKIDPSSGLPIPEEITRMTIPRLGVEWVVPPQHGNELAPGKVKISGKAWGITQDLITAQRTEAISVDEFIIGLKHLTNATLAAQHDPRRSGTKIGFFPPFNQYLKRITPPIVQNEERKGKPNNPIRIDLSGEKATSKANGKNGAERRNPEKIALADFPPATRAVVLTMLDDNTTLYWAKPGVPKERVDRERLNWIQTHGQLFKEPRPFKLEVERQPKKSIDLHDGEFVFF